MIKLGGDVSKYQLKIDWGQYASLTDFCYIRSSYCVDSGALTVDQMWNVNWPGSSHRGMKRGAYHFFHPARRGDDQANFFVDTVGPDLGDLPLAIDVEAPATNWPLLWVYNLKDCLRVVEDRVGRKPLIYTGNWYWDRYVGGVFPDTRWAAAYDLWLAEYVDESQIGLPTPWRQSGWTFWQYTSSGDAPKYGCGGSGLDLDQFEGTAAKWQSLIGDDKVMSNKYKFLDAAGQPTGITVDTPGTIVLDNPPPPLTLDVWTEKYYLGTAWAGNVIFQAMSPGPAMDHSWGSGSPNSLVPNDNFSATFDLDHDFAAGTYEVRVRSDDGFEYGVDGVVPPGLSGLIVQSWGSKEYVGTFTVTAGIHHVHIKYTEYAGEAHITVSAPLPK